MNRTIKFLLVSVAGLFLASCYNDFQNPEPAQIYTDADFEYAGYTYISPAQIKARYKSETGANDGSVASWVVTEPLYTKGKVVSSDRLGNVYKSVYIYDEDSKSAIEVRLSTGNYIFHPVGQIMYVKLFVPQTTEREASSLVVGNYRGMISIGSYSSDVAYSNGNIESSVKLQDHIFSGAQVGMTKADTLVINTDNYTTLTDASLARLVRFEGVTSKFGTAKWGYANTFPNYFANSTSYDVHSPGWEEFCQSGTATWATKRAMPGTPGTTFFYGSAWITYLYDSAVVDGKGDVPSPGNYVIRTSGYSQFYNGLIPDDKAVINVTAILTKFTSASAANATYQLTLNTAGDVVVQQ